MCEAKPGVRCANDTRQASQQSLADYIRAYPGGPQVDPLSSAEAMQAVLDMTTKPAPQPTDPGTATTFDMRRFRPGPPPIEKYGPVDDKHGPFPTMHNDWNVPNPDAQWVMVDGQRFYRRRAGVTPGEPYAVRIEADRELSNEEVRRLAGLVGYAGRAQLRMAEPVGEPHRDGPNSFVVSMDTTKSYSDDIGIAMEEFERTLPAYFEEGSPVRKTDRSGPGTKGTRAVEGVPGVQATVWWDDVHKDNDLSELGTDEALAKLRARLAGDRL